MTLNFNILNMNSLKKHFILKHLYTHWKQGDDTTTSNHEITPFGRTLTTIQLQKSTSYNIKTIEELCKSLLSAKLIEVFKEDIDNKSHRYIITESGQAAYIDRVFFHKFWLYNFDFWKWVLPFLLGASGLLNSIFHWVVKN